VSQTTRASAQKGSAGTRPLDAKPELIDVSRPAREAGFPIRIAMTREVWIDAVEWTDVVEQNKTAPTGQDESRRLWSVLFMASALYRRTRGASAGEFRVYRIPAWGASVSPLLAVYRLCIGRGADGEPLGTITVAEGP
jgi:hypothetical protein